MVRIGKVCPLGVMPVENDYCMSVINCKGPPFAPTPTEKTVRNLLPKTFFFMKRSTEG
jgi:hypothetical protein